MLVYFLVLILILFLRSQLSLITDIDLRRKQENRYLFVVSVILVLLAALRGLNVGADTFGYAIDYYNVNMMSLDYIKDYYSNYVGYYYLSKLFASIGIPLAFWFGFVEAVYMYAICKLIKRYSLDKLLSIFLFFTIGLFTFSVAGLKQVLAMSFMIIAFLNFVDKKYIRFLLFVYLSYICHPVALIFLAAFPLYLIRHRSYYWILIFVSVVFMTLFGKFFLGSMVSMLNDDHFQAYLEFDNSYTSTTLIFYIILILISIVGFRKYLIVDSNTSKLFMGFTILALGLQFLSSISPNMFRLAFFYSPFMTILLPNTLKSIKNPDKQIITTILIVIVTFYFLYTSRTTPYKFFWQ